MKWNHLPSTGGIYDQHPKLLDDFVELMAIESKAKAREAAKQARMSRRK